MRSRVKSDLEDLASYCTTLPTDIHFLSMGECEILAKQRTFAELRACTSLYATDVGQLLLGYALSEVVSAKCTRHYFTQRYKNDPPFEQFYEFVLWCQKELRTQGDNQEFRKQCARTITHTQFARDFLMHIYHKVRVVFDQECRPSDAERYLVELEEAEEEKIVRAGVAIEKYRSIVGEFVKSGLLLVVAETKKRVGKGLSILDLIDEGNQGLFDAAVTYDHRRGAKFSTYAQWWVYQNISRAATDQAKNVRVPNYLQTMYNKIRQAQKEYVERFHHEPTIEELTDLVDLSEEQIQNALRIARTETSLYCPDEDGRPLWCVMETAKVDVSDLEQKEDQDLVERLLNCLPLKTAEVLRLRHGFYGEPWTFEQCGSKIKLSRERIRQIEQAGLKKLQKIIIKENITVPGYENVQPRLPPKNHHCGKKTGRKTRSEIKMTEYDLIARIKTADLAKFCETHKFT